MISADEALKRLKDGNKRFVTEGSDPSAVTSQKCRDELIRGQAPFAIILGCSDSRVPLEIIFDQGLGDLFVIRVAGNVVAPSQIGSIEYAVDQFGTPLVVVMGHTHCGAVTAAVDELLTDQDLQSPNLRSIVDFIRPSVEQLLTTELIENREKLVKAAVRANIKASVDRLLNDSDILTDLIQRGKLKVVPAEYCLETGLVDFF